MKKKQKSSVGNHQSVARASKLNPIHPNAAGIDIGSQNHWVCVPLGRANECVRRFGCYTADLYAIADWLAECRVETVAYGINRCLLDSIVSNLRDSRL